MMCFAKADLPVHRIVSQDGTSRRTPGRPAQHLISTLATLPSASHAANWRQIVWKPILPAALQMRGGMSKRWLG